MIEPEQLKHFFPAFLWENPSHRKYIIIKFLLAQTAPSFDFLEKQCGIGDIQDLKKSLFKTLKSVDLQHKSKDFEHLVFHQASTKKIIHFKEFIEEWEIE